MFRLFGLLHFNIVRFREDAIIWCFYGCSGVIYAYGNVVKGATFIEGSDDRFIFVGICVGGFGNSIFFVYGITHTYHGTGIVVCVDFVIGLREPIFC